MGNPFIVITVLSGQMGTFSDSHSLAGSEAALGELITQHLSEAHFTASQMVFEQQAVGDALYIVQEGRVQVIHVLDTGQRQVLGEIGPGAREKSYPHAQTKAVSSGFQVTRKK